MGMHITVYRVGELIEEFNDNCYDVDRHPNWDSLRYAYDTDFVDETEWECVFPEKHDQFRYRRPKDFAAVRKWLSEKPSFVQIRFTPILDEMEKNPKLVFHIS